MVLSTCSSYFFEPSGSEKVGCGSGDLLRRQPTPRENKGAHSK